jgi:ESS family glutamate:Na+ symporter
MSNAMLTQLLYCFCVLSALLLLGTLLRGIIPLFRKLFLPASVIGGFIGLLIGPIIWKGGGVPL